MGNKKIDNLFQEQLKNLEISPNKRVWNNIEAQLKKKNEKFFLFGGLQVLLLQFCF